MNNIFMCALQHTLAYKFTCTLQFKSSPMVDVTHICSCDYCIISLFAEPILHVGQVPMVVLYLGIIKVWGFWPKIISPKPV